MATIPRQVQEAADVAEAIIARSANGNPDANDDGAEGTGDGEPLEEEDDEPAGGDSAEAEEKNVASEEQNVVPEETWEQKYATLEGKYKAEVPVLQSQLKDYKDQVFSQLNEIIAKKPEEASADEPEEIPEPDKNFKDEYGEEMYAAINAILENRTSKILGEIEPVAKQVAETEETRVNAAREEFSSFIDENVKGDWKKGWAGEDPAFNEFLNKEDPSGLYTFGELLTSYSQKWDKVRFAKVLAMHYGDATAAPAAPAAAVAEAPSAAKLKADNEKAALVAPSRSAGEAPESNSDEEIVWTGASFAQFEKDDRAGKYSPDVSKKMWDSLLKALATNSIR